MGRCALQHVSPLQITFAPCRVLCALPTSVCSAWALLVARLLHHVFRAAVGRAVRPLADGAPSGLLAIPTRSRCAFLPSAVVRASVRHRSIGLTRCSSGPAFGRPLSSNVGRHKQHSEAHMEPIECMHARRSIRAYKADAVGREVIEEVLWATVQAPTPPVSGNKAWAICVVEGQDRLEKYGERARLFAFEHQPVERPWEWTVRPGFKVFWGAPVLVLLCTRVGNSEAPFDCCRAGQNLLLAAHAKGLGACGVGDRKSVV